MPRVFAINRSAASSHIAIQDVKASLRFDGSTTFVTVPFTPDIQGTNLAGWFFLFSTYNSDALVSWITSAGVNGFQLDRENGSNKLYCRVGTATGAKFLDVWSSGQYRVGQWVHIAFTHEQGAQKVYLNGELKDQDNGTMVAASGQSLTLGRRSNMSNVYYNGLQSMVVFQNAAPWSIQQVRAIMSGQVPSGASVLRLDEGAGAVANDASGNGNHGTITDGTFTADVPTRKRSVVGGNLLRNGDFSWQPPFTAATTTTDRWITGVTGGSTTNSLFGWSLWGGGAGGSRSARFDSTVTYGDLPSLKVSTTGAGSETIVTNVLNPGIASDVKTFALKVEPNTGYRIRWNLKTEAVSGAATTGACVGVSEQNSSGTGVVSTFSTGVTATQDFTADSVSITTNAATRYVFIRLNVKGSDGAGTLIMNAWFNDLVVERLPLSTRLP